jgi:hypothetical protein
VSRIGTIVIISNLILWLHLHAGAAEGNSYHIPSIRSNRLPIAFVLIFTSWQ